MAQVNIHYYATYAVCQHLGMPESDCSIVAHSSQFVEDTKQFPRAYASLAYRNSIDTTATTAIKDIAPFSNKSIFHYYSPSLGPVTPVNNPEFISIDNLYQLGIAAHIIVDTFSHASYIGLKDKLNRRKVWLGWDQLRLWATYKPVPFGHEAVLDYPDKICANYIVNGQTIDNRLTYYNAIAALYRLISVYYKTPDPELCRQFMGKVLTEDLIIDTSLKDNIKKWIDVFNPIQYDKETWQGFGDKDEYIVTVSPNFTKWSIAAEHIRYRIIRQYISGKLK